MQTKLGLFLVQAMMLGQAAADCSLALLKSAATAYVQAQTSGLAQAASSSFSSLLADDFIYTENFQSVAPTQRLLNQALPIDHSISIHDPVLCATFTELVVAGGSHPYVIGTRLTLSNGTGTDALQVRSIESVVTDQGDWQFNATGFLYWTRRENWALLAPDDDFYLTTWMPRDILQRQVDQFLDVFASATISNVAFGSPCARLEGGGKYTGQGRPLDNTCNQRLSPDVKVSPVGERRYVIDEEAFAVNVMMGVKGLDRGRAQLSIPDSHLFRVEGGWIRYMHMLSVCATPGCGMNGTV